MPELPTGTVTFVYADLEGSTRLVQVLGEAYPAVLADARRLLCDAVEPRGGHEIDRRGDEMFFVFADADTAVEAAIEAQRSFIAHDWPEEGPPVRVRIGVHTGTPQLGEEGYMGVDVHRVVRIANAGHGGQIVVSQPTRERISASTRDLGEYELAGISEPVRLYQVLADGLHREFPPLRYTRERRGDAVRVVLAEDSVLLREGVAMLLTDAGFDVVAQSGTAEDLLRHVAMHKPNVAIVDIRMPPTHTDEGLRAAKEIRDRHAGTSVLVLSQYVEPAYALELLSENAEGVGYLLKDRISDVDEFAAAVRRVAEGGSALDPAVVNQLVGKKRKDDPLDALTPREREVLELMAEGRSNQAIAERMFVTLRAVEKHVTSIFEKLRLPASSDDHRRVLAVLAYLRS